MDNYKYFMNMICQNCGHKFVEAFAKGTPCVRDNYGRNEFHYCPNCGCIRAVATIKAGDPFNGN